MEGAKEPFTCCFCSRGFARSDALKRHWTSCRIRKERGLQIPIVEAKARGRKLKACDRCYRLKRACTSTEPCEPCAVRKQLCKYSRPQARRAEGTNSAKPIIEECISNDEGSSVGSEEGDDGVLLEQDAEDVVSDGDRNPREGEHGVDDVMAPHDREFETSLDHDNITTFDLSMYESAFEVLGDGNNDINPMTDIDNATVDLMPHSLALASNSHLDLDCWSMTGSLLFEHSLSSSLYPRPTHLNIDLLIQFPFLERFTNTTGFARSFECGTKQQRLSITLNSSILKTCGKPLALEDRSSNPAMHWVDITRDALRLQDTTEVGADAILLLSTTRKIVSRIREMSISKVGPASREIVWSPSMEALCFRFFNPVSIQKNLALFWSCWYPNWPAIHRPTFEATRKSPALIAAMTLVGACLSPDDRDYASAQVWFDAVEDMVFSDKTFTDHDISSSWQSSRGGDLRGTHLDMLQAAYCVCLYQTWEGCKRSKRRALRQRFSDLVYLARDLGLAQASLRSIDTTSPAAFDWEEYILRESLVRVCSYINAIDASFALFYRHTPRMVLSELTFDLSSPESCFQASSRQECFIELKTWRTNMGLDVSMAGTNLTVLSAIEALHDDKLMAQTHIRRAFSHLSVLNMFIIIHALYLQVYRLETSPVNSLSPAETAPIVTALKQWKEVWPSSTRDDELADLVSKESRTSTLWQRLGFIRHVPEYWLMAWLSLVKIQEKGRRGSALVATQGTGGVDEDMKEVRGVLAGFKSEHLVAL